MSLKVWLPLNGDLKNNGLSNYSLSIFRGTETYNNDGKIGKCFYSNGVNTIKILNIIPDFYKYSEYSLCAWFYIETNNTSHSGSAIISSGNWNQQVINLAVSDWSTDHYTKLRISGTSWGQTYSYNFNKNTWYHVVVSSDGNKTYAYVNGTLIGNTAPGFLPSSIEGNDICIGGATYYSGMQFYGRINDVRIYDHCLSINEIKEISKGLVCHYKLDDYYVSDNLIINGFGELGNENWISSINISTTEIPSSHSEIKASFYGGNMTKEYIPINSNHSYTISAYLKTFGATTGTTYPSIFPYDYDKKFIWTYNCSEGFSVQYKTTLAQPLKKGDTVIYATNLNAWTTADTNYYFHVAIFGYKDSRGYTYPDMIYTADSPAFGTKTDKSHIDKTNNTITLNAPFTGEDRPAGTTICQATEGSTYYYPFGGVALANIQDWTFKTATFTPKSHNRLKACKYIKWQAYSGAYYAGNKLVDNDDNSKDVCDSSGYGNHGEIVGTLNTSTNTARNSLSTVFNGTNSYIEADSLPSETKTISVWAKFTLPSSGYRIIMHDRVTGLAIGFSGNTKLITYIGSGNGGSGSNVSTSLLNLGEWNHIVVIKTGDTTRTVYINGQVASNNSNNYWGSDLNKLLIGVRHLSGSYNQYFDGQLSDFRAYVTALSADDVKELYQVSAKIDKSGKMYGYELKED